MKIIFVLINLIVSKWFFLYYPNCFPQKVICVFQAIRATFHIHKSWQSRQVSFSEVNCPHSMSANSAGSAQWDIFSFTLKWTYTIKHESARRTLAVFQGENAALSQRQGWYLIKGRCEVMTGYSQRSVPRDEASSQLWRGQPWIEGTLANKY